MSRIIASARAIALAYGPEAGEELNKGSQGGFSGWRFYAEPDWWETSYEGPRLDTSCPDWLLHPENYGTVVIPKHPNPTVRVSVKGGPVLWEDAA